MLWLSFAFKVVEYSDGLFCSLQWNDTFGESFSFEGYFLGVIIVFFYVPLVSIAILYFAIALTIKSQKSPGEQSANVRKQYLRRERTVLKLSIAVVLVFAVCWLPFSIMFVFFLFSSDSAMISSCSFQYSQAIAFSLAQSYCAVNPCICFIFSGNYRQRVKNFLSCFSSNEAA